MRKILLLLMLTLTLSVSATSRDTLNAVTMVSYEQGWLDDTGALALKNNTEEDIHNVSFRITYLDMKGNALDYEDYSSEVEIAPGMTKKVNITAYEHGRGYSYFRSEARPGMPHRFKIRFKLTGYNTAEINTTEEEASDTYSIADSTSANGVTNEAKWVAGLIIFGFILIICIYVGMYGLVAIMAKRRHRNAIIWIFISLIGTPLIVIVVLLCLGDADDSYEDRFE